jgi:uncharacterized damage-inducible protein DinB
MALVEVIRTMVQYNDEMNRKVWKSIFQLSDEQFLAPVDYSHSSVRNQMVHLAAVDGRWTRGLQGQPDARAFNPSPSDYPTRASAFELWDPIAREFCEYTLSLREEDLLAAPAGLKEPAWQVILHVVNHGTDHRAQLLRVLHDAGAPTFPQDLIMYLWAKAG